MGFGLSGSQIDIQMQGADPTLVWVDGLTGPQAVDYHLSAYHKVSNILPDSLAYSILTCSLIIDNSFIQKCLKSPLLNICIMFELSTFAYNC